MKSIVAAVNRFSQEDIYNHEQNGFYTLSVDGQTIEILLSEVTISTDDIPGWLISNIGNLTIALDVTVTESLKQEGLARELVNRIQNIRKESGFEVTDRICLEIEKIDFLNQVIENNFSYICSETLAESLDLVDTITGEGKVPVELTEEYKTNVRIEKAGYSN